MKKALVYHAPITLIHVQREGGDNSSIHIDTKDDYVEITLNADLNKKVVIRDFRPLTLQTFTGDLRGISKEELLGIVTLMADVEVFVAEDGTSEIYLRTVSNKLEEGLVLDELNGTDEDYGNCYRELPLIWIISGIPGSIHRHSLSVGAVEFLEKRKPQTILSKTFDGGQGEISMINVYCRKE